MNSPTTAIHNSSAVHLEVSAKAALILDQLEAPADLLNLKEAETPIQQHR